MEKEFILLTPNGSGQRKVEGKIDRSTTSLSERKNILSSARRTQEKGLGRKEEYFMKYSINLIILIQSKLILCHSNLTNRQTTKLTNLPNVSARSRTSYSFNVYFV